MLLVLYVLVLVYLYMYMVDGACVTIEGIFECDMSSIENA